ncbi:MAG: YicC family protein [Bryobacterales bacterium]|nr:YicC family protein [Bryobacterales bacterium]
MTGFARVRKSGEEGDAAISVKSVNHRGLDVHFHMSDDLAGYEAALRSVVKRMALRGHFQVRVSFTRSRPAAAALNRGLLAAYLAALREASAELGQEVRPDLNAALCLPGMLRETAEEPDAAAEQLLVSALEEAMAALNAFREREGAALAADLAMRARAVAEAGDRLRELRARAVPAFARRLSERLSELLGGAAVEPQRLAQEAALLADRGDIEEELTRLKVHAAQLSELLRVGGEVGKKLDFLLQEMGRETNTILSKTTGLGDAGLEITDVALAAKSEIEKIREQALNLE